MSAMLTRDAEHDAVHAAADAPLISIVVVSYNYERYLRDALRSALGQNYENVEVIVVDDGSTDGSRAIIEEFRAQVIAIFQANHRETAAVNAGFAASHGEVVIFLDSDDLLRPGAAAAVAKVWRPGLAKAQFGLQIIDRDGNNSGAIEPQWPTAYSGDKLKRDFAATNTYIWPPSSGNAFSRNFLQQALPLPPAEFPFAPDGILCTLAPLYGEIYTITEPLGCYRVHGNNMWALDRFDPKRLVAYLAHRRKEVGYLRRRAAQLGIVLAASDPLDHGLAFLRYRLVLAKLRLHTAPEPPLAVLCWRVTRLLHRLDMARRQRALEFAWFVAVAVVPRRLARMLVELRFARSRRPSWVGLWLKRFHSA
jgi:glycosyltransferase involved in cell wall biosynthesis